MWHIMYQLVGETAEEKMEKAICRMCGKEIEAVVMGAYCSVECFDRAEAEAYWREGERALQGPLFDESTPPPWERGPEFVPVAY